MRVAATLAGLLCAVAAPGTDERSPPFARTLPDVLVVVLDDLNGIGMDSVPTPTLDALAGAGVTFDRFYTASWCAPTRSSLFLSSYDMRPRGDGCDDVYGPDALTTDARTMADFFHALGYRTGFFGKWHLGPVVGYPWELAPNQLGFDTARAWIPVNVGGCGGRSYDFWTRVDNGSVSYSTRWADEEIAKALKAWWQPTRVPRFAMLCFQEAHAPYLDVPPRLPPGYPPPNPAIRREVYQSMIAHVDMVLGEVLAAVGPSTWVVVLGDNGTQGCNPVTLACENDVTFPGEDPLKVKSSPYEGGIRNRAIFYAPRIPNPGSIVLELAQVADVLPTLADGIGVRVPYPVDGVSLVPLMYGSRGVRDWAYAQDPGLGWKALIEDRLKLIDRGAGELELYDLFQDPGETLNLAGDPGHVRDLYRTRAILAGLP